MEVVVVVGIAVAVVVAPTIGPSPPLVVIVVIACTGDDESLAEGLVSPGSKGGGGEAAAGGDGVDACSLSTPCRAPCSVPGKNSNSSHATPFRRHVLSDKAHIIKVKANNAGPVWCIIDSTSVQTENRQIQH
jgi:hypothetical protein